MLRNTAMSRFNPQRRDFIVGAAVSSIGPVLFGFLRANHRMASSGFVLAPDEGERLVHFRDGGRVVIKIGVTTGSPDLALGTQQVMKGTGIPIHRHSRMNEMFSVLEGGGTVLLDDVRYPFEKGSTIFIPNGVWHGFENADHELLLQWVVSPSGLDAFFRETCSPLGTPPKSFTKDQIRDIARRHDTEFR